MKTLTDHLAQYAAYHRDRRNILTHFLGIPMIVVAITTLLAKPAWQLAGVTVTPAWLLLLFSALFYLRLCLGLGTLMSILLLAAVGAGDALAQGSTSQWLAWGLGLFIVGWILQFIGHYFEGRKPAFVDDLVGLIVGPLFVVVELLFLLGMLPGLKLAIESRVGPVH
ncbi:DUF962 domain-containing protein [Gallaecimonas sp. GXIMD1310]|uniref:Mpo1 family 2-hydroxy fatty acid dioxygenase n=1 Tax=Gallaecimonas sp. GXIMD1310 TaxID=3131926 RepID=UPI003245F430